MLASVAGDLGLGYTRWHTLSPAPSTDAVAVNLTANFRLIRSMDPLLRASPRPGGPSSSPPASPRTRHKPFWGAYAASKAGMESLVRCWADEMAHTDLRCVLVDPGAMRTRMRNAAFPGEDPATLPPPEAIGPLMVDLARGDREPAETLVSFRAA